MGSSMGSSKGSSMGSSRGSSIGIAEIAITRRGAYTMRYTIRTQFEFMAGNVSNEDFRKYCDNVTAKVKENIAQGKLTYQGEIQLLLDDARRANWRARRIA
jgi:hypothetical protein